MAGKREYRRFHLVVRDRSRIQQIALELPSLLDNHYRGKSGRRSRNPYDLLVGATFSLWRAVFLVEPDKDWDTLLDNAETFPEKVIRDNAIGYADDWNNRRWSFAFYANNARYRLIEFAELAPEFKARTRKFKYLQAIKEPAMGSNPFLHWNGLCEALRDAINVLREKVRREQPAKKSRR